MEQFVEGPEIDLQSHILKRIWRNHRRTLYAALAASLGSVAVGTIIGYPATAIPDINAKHSSFHLNKLEISFVASIGPFGGTLGSLLGGYFLDKFGRKDTLIYNTIPLVFGWLLMAGASDVYVLCVGRIICGYCAGLIDTAVSVYNAEVATADVRGFMGSFVELFTNVGMLYTYAFGSLLSWRWTAVGCQLVPLAMIICMLFVAESPRWLLRVGRREECLKNLEWLRGEEKNYQSELNELVENVAASQQATSLWEELRKPNVNRPLLIITGLIIFMQLVGASTIPQYVVTILSSAGAEWTPYGEAVVFGLVGVITNTLSAIVVDKLGRRIVLFTSAAIIILGYTALASYFTILEYFPNVNIRQYSYVTFAGVLLVNIAAAYGYSTIPFVLTSELLPLNVRGRLAGIGISFLWLFMFIMSFLFPFGVSSVGFCGVFWVLNFFSVLSVLFFYFAIPETKGLTLEEIEKNYLHNSKSSTNL